MRRLPILLILLGLVAALLVTSAAPDSDAIFCPSCGAKNPAEARFCSECGGRIADSEDIPQEAPEVPREERFSRHIVRVQVEAKVMDVVFEDGRFVEKESLTRGAGSAVVIDSTGLAITNSHVVAGHKKAWAYDKDGKRMEVTVLGDDPLTDLALLRLKPAPEVPALSWAKGMMPSEAETLWLIGNPLDIGISIHRMAVVSRAYHRWGIQPIEMFILLSRTAVPGMSGGGCFSKTGELIGITAYRRGNHANIIPAFLAKEVADRLLRDGEANWGWLGMAVSRMPETGLVLDQDIPKRTDGLYVLVVAVDSPAYKVGIQRGDYIESIDGEPLADAGISLLQLALSDKPIGTPVKLIFVRKDKRYKATIKTEPRELEPVFEPYDLFYMITGVRLRKEVQTVRKGVEKVKFYADKVEEKSWFSKRIQKDAWLSGLVSRTYALSAFAGNVRGIISGQISPLATEDRFRTAMKDALWHDPNTGETFGFMYTRWGFSVNPVWAGFTYREFPYPLVL
jgi:S1-C subfamily serine protease